MRQLAAYHNQGNVGTIRWHPKGSTSLGTVVAHIGADSQSVLPRKADGSGPAIALLARRPAKPSASASTASGPRQPKTTRRPIQAPAVRARAAIMSGCGRVRDRAGALMPDTWLLGMDYSGINYDYNDNVYLIGNIKPKQAAFDPATPGCCARGA